VITIGRVWGFAEIAKNLQAKESAVKPVLITVIDYLQLEVGGIRELQIWKPPLLGIGDPCAARSPQL